VGISPFGQHRVMPERCPLKKNTAKFTQGVTCALQPLRSTVFMVRDTDALGAGAWATTNKTLQLVIMGENEEERLGHHVSVRRGSYPMSPAFVRSLLVVAPALITATNALAHDSWINRGAFKNAAGEWCCGDYDCKSYTRASSTTTGWIIDAEFVPFDEAMPVAPPDGQVTICRRPDGSRRCVFGLKPGL
jgi:hypothetical protein